MFEKRMKKILSLLLALVLMPACIPAAADGTDAPAATPAPAVTPVPTETTAPKTEQLMAVVKYTTYGRINMRALPSETSDRVGVLSGGTLVKVLDQGNGHWILVEGEGKIGYMSTNFLELFYEGETPPIPVKPEATPTPTSRPASYYSSAPAEVAVVSWQVTENTIMYVDTANKKSLNLRAGPSTGYSAIRSYAVGTEVRVLARRGDWAYVQVGTRLGFMMLNFLSYSKPDPLVPYNTEIPAIATVTVVHPWGSFVNLRSSTTTDTNKNILAQIPHGTQVELLIWDFWYSLIRYNGITGYIVTSYLDLNN